MGLFLAPAEGFSLQQRLFSAFGQKRAFYAVLDHFFCHFLCLVVTLVTYGSKGASKKNAA